MGAAFETSVIFPQAMCFLRLEPENEREMNYRLKTEILELLRGSLRTGKIVRLLQNNTLESKRGLHTYHWMYLIQWMYV